MGWSYTHLVLFGPNQQHAAAALSNRHAVISRTVNGFTLVADEEFETHDEEGITALGAQLSKKLECPVLVVSEFDDDVLSYKLIQDGTVIDEYNSEPDYFDFAAKNVPPRGPQGGDAEILCTALRRPTAREQVGRILHNEDHQLQAPERHQALAEALGMPQFAVGFDYRAVQNGELPEGLDESDVIFTTTEPG